MIYLGFILGFAAAMGIVCAAGILCDMRAKQERSEC